MKTFRHAVVPLIAVLSFSALAPPSSADAAPAGHPITCGMVVQDDAQLYLARDLYCPDFGVRLEQHPSIIPTIKIDLRGHTLRGPGSGYGISGFTPGVTSNFPVEAQVEVRNGRLNGWEVALSSGTELRARDIVLVNNETGFLCFGSCYLDRSHVSRSSEAGLVMIGDGGGGGAVVTRTSFVKNQIGAQIVGGYPSMTISDSLFLANDVGAQADAAQVRMSHTLIVKNRVGVLVTGWDTPWPGDTYPCAGLTNVRFVWNGTNLDGPPC